MYNRKSTSIILLTGLLILFCACRIVEAIRPKPGEKTRVTQGGGAFAEVTRGLIDKSQVALTFDAGTETECFEELMTALASARVHCTFFITGKFANDHPDCAVEITKQGHEIGNHTWSHVNLTLQSDEVIRDEILRADRRLTEVFGQSPRPRWRAPYGARDDRMLRIASNLGYRSIHWTLDSLDGVEPAKSPQFLFDRITSQSDRQLDGAIILMHVGVRSTAEALPAIILNLQERGFHLVTISQLLQPTAASN